jgi:3-oxoacyl-[acyl-carrier-protein] synthase-3
MEHVGEKLGIPSEKTIVTVQNQANTSAATIPLALAQAAADGCFEAGQIAALTAMGGGFTWGAALVRL